jgi:hypothetical protein
VRLGWLLKETYRLTINLAGLLLLQHSLVICSFSRPLSDILSYLKCARDYVPAVLCPHKLSPASTLSSYMAWTWGHTSEGLTYQSNHIK